MIMQVQNQPRLCLWIFDRQHSMNRITALALLFCLVFFLFPLSVFSQIISDEALELLEGQQGSSPKKDQEKSGLIDKPDIEYKAVKSRDPFQPQFFTPDKSIKKKTEVKIEGLIESTAPKISELFLISIQGIIWNSDIPLVIINNKVLRKGEVLLIKGDKEVREKITITDIDKDGVTINYLGRVERLSYPPPPKLEKIKKGEEK